MSEAPVFCEECAGVVQRDDRRVWRAGADRGGLLLCQRCGRLLEGHATPLQLRAKLSQLRRFGLVGRPIVRRAGEGD